MSYISNTELEACDTLSRMADTTLMVALGMNIAKDLLAWEELYGRANIFSKHNTKDRNLRCSTALKRLRLDLRKYLRRRACTRCDRKVQLLYCNTECRAELCLECTENTFVNKLRYKM